MSELRRWSPDGDQHRYGSAELRAGTDAIPSPTTGWVQGSVRVLAIRSRRSITERKIGIFINIAPGVGTDLAQ